MNRKSIEQIEKSWEEATFANSFIFYSIMTTYPDVCRHVIEILLDKKIDRIDFPEGETTLAISPQTKGIRLDVYTKTEYEAYDVEMQIKDTGCLEKRSRYYLSIMDADGLNRGEDYRTLKDSYALFICFSDIFGKGLPMYPFENYCTLDKELRLGDGRYTVFFNATKYAKMDTEERKNFFGFLNGIKTENSFESKLEELVHMAKQKPDWRKAYMTWEMEIKDSYNEGYKSGHDDGVGEGINKAAVENALAIMEELRLSREDSSRILRLTPEQIKMLDEQLAKN